MPTAPGSCASRPRTPRTWTASWTPRPTRSSWHQGEIYGIIGYSGAGKSSLIRLLNGLETPTTGTVEVAGNDIGKIKGRKLRKARQEISMVFQHFNILWSRTVRENIAFPLEIAGISKEKRI